MTTIDAPGRLGNQIIRNLATSLIAEKHDLYVCYRNSYDLIQELGIDLFIGNKIYENYIHLNDNNYFDIYNSETLLDNLHMYNDYFQTKEITNFLYKHLNSKKIKTNIINKNPFKENYQVNNDLYIHIRLGDVEHLTPGIDYYMKAISLIQFDNLYISSDSVEHSIVKQIIEKYPNLKIIDYDEKKTIQFASTCKNIILSHGSFSAVIGYLAFFSTIYYPEYEEAKIWYGDMFSIPGWNKIVNREG
jgi:hypothetical protein